jgi:hypothetical protein
VTLSKTEGVPEQLDLIQNLLGEGTKQNLGIKDSFCALDLRSLGFQLLFKATWLWREPSRPKPAGVAGGLEWDIVQEPTELARWEVAWNVLLNDDHSPQPSRVFLPSLLVDRDVAFLAARQGHQIVAGAIANRSGDVVGVSNVFTPEEDALFYWAGCVAAITDAFPGRPLVGQEWGDELEVALQLGFEALGPLRVWTR